MQAMSDPSCAVMTSNALPVQVFAFRMSLWSEHLGTLAPSPSFTRPWTLSCMRAVRASSQARWQRFIGEEACELEGHLVPYPLDVKADGSVVPLEGFEEFVDFGGRVIGAPSRTLPDLLTG